MLEIGAMLKLFVGPVAERRRGAVLAAAEIDGLGLGGFEFQRREAASLVAAIAEGLIGALAAGAPEVALSGFDGNGIGGLLWNGGSGMVGSPGSVMWRLRHSSNSRRAAQSRKWWLHPKKIAI